MFLFKVNRESWDVLAYAGVNVLELQWYAVRECTSYFNAGIRVE